MDYNTKLGKIIKLIANKPGITRQELLAELNSSSNITSLRSLANDIKILKEEFKLIPDKSRLKNGYVLNDIFTVNETELPVVMNALCTFAEQLQDISAVEAYRKIQTSILAQDKKLTVFYEHSFIREKNIIDKTSHTDEIEKVLSLAIKKNLAIRVEYKSPRSESFRTVVYPIFKVFYIRAWYVVCKSINDKTFNPYRLDRFTKITILDKKNTNFKKDYNLAKELLNIGWGMSFPASKQKAQDFIELVVGFDKSVAPYIKEGKQRHQNAKLRTLDNGNLEFKIQLSDPWEFCHWVRSFGSLAWFIKPKELVEIEINDLKNKACRYNLNLPLD